MPKGRGAQRSTLTLEEETDRLRALTAEPHSAQAADGLGVALKSQRSLVVARAAAVIRDHHVEGLSQGLENALKRFLRNPVKSDPGCHAKLAVIEALDCTDHPDSEPFLVAARHVQPEPAWGPPVDTAVALRARAIIALERTGHSDLQLVAGELLADPASLVRQAALQAVARRGDRNSAALVLLKILTGDDDPLVMLASMEGLLSLAPDWGIPRLRTHLFGNHDELRDSAAVALGRSGREDSLQLLLEYMEATPLAPERAIVLRALALHRSERSLAVLLEVVAEGNADDARTAVASLGVRRFDPGIHERVCNASQHNKGVDLGAAIAEAFSTPGG